MAYWKSICMIDRPTVDHVFNSHELVKALYSSLGEETTR